MGAMPVPGPINIIGFEGSAGSRNVESRIKTLTCSFVSKSERKFEHTPLKIVPSDFSS